MKSIIQYNKFGRVILLNVRLNNHAYLQYIHTSRERGVTIHSAVGTIPYWPLFLQDKEVGHEKHIVML